MQSGNEAAAVNLAAALCSVAEPDYVGAALAKSGTESKLLGVVTGVRIVQWGLGGVGTDERGTTRGAARPDLRTAV